MNWTTPILQVLDSYTKKPQSTYRQSNMSSNSTASGSPTNMPPPNLTSNKPGAGSPLNEMHYIFICASAVTAVVFVVLALACLRKYRSLIYTIQDLQGAGQLVPSPPPDPPAVESLTVVLGQGASSASPLHRQTTKSASRPLWRTSQPGSRFSKADLSLQQLIKAGSEGVFYKAKMTRGTCKGHSMFTCKMTKEGATHKQVEREISIMRKLGTHKNVLQLLDWDIAEPPYMLVMELVTYGTLRSFLQVNKKRLCQDSEVQRHFTVAAYHIAHAMDHLHSRMVVHCDLAVRNIMVSSFPREVKVAEFGLARDLTCMRSRRSSRKKSYRERVPLRWYPPEYFRNNYYGFKGDVWAFGIVLWEMQTFGTLPYPNLQTSEEVVRHVCAGHRNSDPHPCRPEILEIMRDCWMEPYSMRPSFMDIVRVLENILENDADYVDVDNRRQMPTAGSGD